jgi:hypothetical protein
MDNPIHRLLDAHALPWRAPRAELAARYGVRPHPAYGWDVIAVPTEPPLVSGLMSPLSVQVAPQFTPHLPPTDFSGESWFTDDARENLRLTAEQLAAALGPADIADRHNTIQCEWRCGVAALTLTVWPPHLQDARLTNPAHAREPKLATACRIAVETGWRVEPTAKELAWLQSFVPLAPIKGDQDDVPAALRFNATSPYELEFIREPPPGLDALSGQVGCSADGGALIFRHAQLYLVALDRVLGFKVQRTKAARGRGGSRLNVECRTDFAAVTSKRLTISRAPGVEDLNDLVAALSAATGKPFELGKYSYDE